MHEAVARMHVPQLHEKRGTGTAHESTGLTRLSACCILNPALCNFFLCRKYDGRSGVQRWEPESPFLAASANSAIMTPWKTRRTIRTASKWANTAASARSTRPTRKPNNLLTGVASDGRAEKKQVQEMTKKLLDLSSFNMKENNRNKDDASDALGVAICASLHNKFLVG